MEVQLPQTPNLAVKILLDCRQPLSAVGHDDHLGSLSTPDLGRFFTGQEVVQLHRLDAFKRERMGPCLGNGSAAWLGKHLFSQFDLLRNGNGILLFATCPPLVEPAENRAKFLFPAHGWFPFLIAKRFPGKPAPGLPVPG